MPKHPESIECSAQPFDLSFHPRREHLLATALVDGTVELHDFSAYHDADRDDDDDEHDTIISSIPVHSRLIDTDDASPAKTASCRAVGFSRDGSKIYTGGSLGDVCALDAERACALSASLDASLLWKLPSTKSHAIHVLHQLPPDAGSLLVTGDEMGWISLWDERSQHKPVVEYNENNDYISGVDYHDHTLLCSSADSTLSVIDLRKATSPPTRAESLRQSDDQEDELLSVKVMKHGKKVVCGTQEGVLAVWSWGIWGDISDRFPGHPASIDALLKVDEDTLLTGSSDGLVRLVQIHPDKLLGVLGDHDGYPIERLQFNSTRSVVGSVSHDPMIRLWDARVLQDDAYRDEDDDESGEETKESTPTRVASKPASVGSNSDDEWDDDDEEEEDLNDGDDSTDDDSSDEDEKETANDKRAKRLKTDNEKFFEDL